MATEAKCERVRIKGASRVLCWADKPCTKGTTRWRITANRGGGKMATKTGGYSPKTHHRSGKARKTALKGLGTMRVSRARAMRANGTLKKGCRFVKGGGAVCKKSAR